MGKSMINYSVYMMRNPQNPESPEKAYAKNQVTEIWSLDKFARHIAEHNGVYSRGTVKGVLADSCECLVEQLLDGKKVKLGELGTFGISISSEGAPSLNEFTSKNIKAVNILFAPGPDFTNLIDRAEFNLVASRVAQAAVLKAEKSGDGTVDLAAAKNKGTSAEPMPDKPTDPDNTPGGGENGCGVDSGLNPLS